MCKDYIEKKKLLEAKSQAMSVKMFNLKKEKQLLANQIV